MKDREERYTPGDELGRGAFGRVILGVDERLKRTIAIKLLEGSEDATPEDVEAFLDEAIITGRLEHPNIVPTYDVGRSDELGVYYTMKRLPGRSLADEIADLAAGRPGLGFFRRVTAFSDICRAVAFAHERRVVHTDLKPANVLLGEQQEIVVADWGLALVLDEAASRAAVYGGTPSYMSPEQASGLELDERTDVWSLGVILFELLTLERPFGGSTESAILESILTDAAPTPSMVAPGFAVPEELEDICRRALAKSRVDRYSSVAEMLRDVNLYVEGTRERSRREDRAQRSVELARGALTDEAFVEHVCAALDAQPDSSSARRLASERYWQLFQKKDLNPRVIEMLSSLARRALPDIVRYRPASPQSVATDNTDPWLTAVSAFVSGDDALTTASDETLELVERVRLLRGIELFKSLEAYELLPVAAACRAQSFGPGERIFSMGEAADALYLVTAGTIDIDLNDVVVNEVGVGEVLGEIAVLQEQVRTAGAVAGAAGSTCLVLDAARFRRVVRENGDIGLAVIAVLTERLRAAAHREAELLGALDQ